MAKSGKRATKKEGAGARVVGAGIATPQAGPGPLASGMVRTMEGEEVEGAKLEHIAPALRGFAVRVSSLKRDPDNARRHGERDLPSTAASLKRFGQQHVLHFEPGSRVIKVGSGRHEAAQAILGWEWIAAVPSNLPVAELKAFGLSDNRTGELSEWDPEVLERQLEELSSELPDFSAEDFGLGDLTVEALLDGDYKEAHGFSPVAKKPEMATAAIKEQFKIIISCESEAQQAELIEEFEGRGLKYTAPSV